MRLSDRDLDSGGQQTTPPTPQGPLGDRQGTLQTWLDSAGTLPSGRSPALRGGGFGTTLARAFRQAPFLPFSRLPKPASFERIRLNIVSKWLLKSQDDCAVIAFTSLSRGEGVSTVVAGLARSFGHADPGGVLVLDGSGGKRGVSRLLGVKAMPATVPDVEADLLELQHRITPARRHGVDILALADVGPLRWSSAKFCQMVLARLRPSYRTILVDAGALAASWAACWLGCSNYRVLVIDSSIATREVLEHHRNELERGGIVVDGSILNKRSYPIPRLFYWLAR
jgi:Mrp family chromosome partitioning ATPase